MRRARTHPPAFGPQRGGPERRWCRGESPAAAPAAPAALLRIAPRAPRAAHAAAGAASHHAAAGGCVRSWARCIRDWASEARRGRASGGLPLQLTAATLRLQRSVDLARCSRYQWRALLCAARLLRDQEVALDASLYAHFIEQLPGASSALALDHSDTSQLARSAATAAWGTFRQSPLPLFDTVLPAYVRLCLAPAKRHALKDMGTVVAIVEGVQWTVHSARTREGEHEAAALALRRFADSLGTSLHNWERRCKRPTGRAAHRAFATVMQALEQKGREFEPPISLSEEDGEDETDIAGVHIVGPSGQEEYVMLGRVVDYPGSQEEHDEECREVRELHPAGPLHTISRSPIGSRRRRIATVRPKRRKGPAAARAERSGPAPAARPGEEPASSGGTPETP
eukprot:TRINITY_DN31993_c0_g1_i1.p1 TRINITY_DN31993_c0_g1~~TRINITY_DN31993_c0_g1_i1.p1  ORF type:complete len:422 (+),score=62.95 TRINITY_DN31993_c0_g1_i1:74-1267(+)